MYTFSYGISYGISYRFVWTVHAVFNIITAVVNIITANAHLKNMC